MTIGNVERVHRAVCPSLAVAFLVIVFAFCGSLCLQGCKTTDVLTERIEDEVLGTLDPTADPVFKENPEAPEDPTHASTIVKESDRIDDQELGVPVYDEDAAENGEAIYREYKKSSAHDQPATKGTETTQKQEEVSERPEDVQTPEKLETPQQAEEEKDGEGAEEGGESEGDDEGEFKVGGGVGGTGNVYDTTGETQKLPEYCNKVAAAGVYATIVEMLGGEGGLVAADAAWKKAVAKKGLFPGEKVSNVQTVWSGDNAKGYKLDVAKLIAAQPDAVLVDGVKVRLDKAAKKKVKAAKIDVITVPTLGDAGTPDDFVVKAVDTVGELLKNSTLVHYDTQASASTYDQMHEQTINSCKEANGGYSTKSVGGTSYDEVYQDSTGRGNGVQTAELSGNRITTVLFDSWTAAKASTATADRRYSSATPLYLDGETIDTSDGLGLSATVSNNGFALVDYYLQVSGIVNNAYDYKRPQSDEGGTSTPYPLVAGSPVGLLRSALKTTNRHAPSALWYSPNSYSADSDWLAVGDSSDFPGVIAKDANIAASIVASAAKENGLYNVGKPYKVWVMPSGIDGSWSLGTPESYLASAWALKTFWDDGDAAEFSDSCVNTYYQTFYRCKQGKGTSFVDDYETVKKAKCPVDPSYGASGDEDGGAEEAGEAEEDGQGEE